jgi:hypothetical protein
VDSAAAVGLAVITRAVRLLHGLVALLVVVAPAAALDERYALVVTGASGTAEYAQKYDRLRGSFVGTLSGRFGYPDDHVIVLAEHAQSAVREANRENVRAALHELVRRADKDDVVLVLLIGHGTVFEGEEAKFNLVGPDLTAADWAALVRPIAGRLVFVNTSSASFPFLKAVAGQGRVVLTATDSAAQQFETVFPEFFVQAFEDIAADIDKNGKVSVWEAFGYASAGVRDRFAEQGRLATERALLDDTGVGVGSEADTPGRDGALARGTYLEAERATAPSRPGLADLLRSRAVLGQQLERLKAGQPTLDSKEYEAELERLLLELSSIDRQIREKS